jgi:hypothetical protein
LYLWSDVSYVSDDAELYVLITYQKTVVAVTIVRYGNSLYSKGTNVKRFVVGDCHLLLGAHLFVEKGVVEHAFMDGAGGVDGDVKFVREVTHRLGVVRVIVRDKDALDVSE